MKVEELIEALKQMPQDREVWIWSDSAWQSVPLGVVDVDSDGDVAVAEREMDIG